MSDAAHPPWLPEDWFMPSPGTRLRQIVDSGPFVAQHREALGAGAARLTRHRRPRETSFTVVGYEERPEIGMSCHVVHLRDDGDGRRYIVECGLMGPGLPRDTFAEASEDPRSP